MSDMSECAGEMARLQVAVLRGTCQTPGAPPKPVYGLQVESDSHHWCWQDLDVDRRRVETLAHRLEEMNPSGRYYSGFCIGAIFAVTSICLGALCLPG